MNQAVDLRIHAPGKSHEEAVHAAMEMIKEQLETRLAVAGMEIRPKIVGHEIKITELLDLKLANFVPGTVGKIFDAGLTESLLQQDFLAPTKAVQAMLDSLENEGYVIVRKEPKNKTA